MQHQHIEFVMTFTCGHILQYRIINLAIALYGSESQISNKITNSTSVVFQTNVDQM